MSTSHGSERGLGRGGCTDRKAHRRHWRVRVRNANYSAFNGGRRTPSDYSALTCTLCGGSWRTKAAYVDELPDLEVTVRIPLSQLNGEGLARAFREAEGKRRGVRP